MPFSDSQIKDLKAPLDSSKVSERDKAGTTLSYVEGWHVISEANRIFGFDGWDRETELIALGEPELGKDRYDNDQWRVRYMARVCIRVRAGETDIIRHGAGYGSGIAKDMGDAYEGAIKEAETDATKRALMTFGNPFGLALYDKSRENVCDGSKVKYLETCRAHIESATDVEKLRAWWKAEAQARRDFGLSQGDVDGLLNALAMKVKTLQPVKEEAA